MKSCLTIKYFCCCCCCTLRAMETEGDNNIFTGEDGEVVPSDATHVTVHESVKAIPARGHFFGILTS
jgi:hypothetical protein